MAKIRRLTDSCIHVLTDDAATIFDPGFHTFTWDHIDLSTVGDVTRVLISHEHGDHVHPEFVAWLIDRGNDVAIHSNRAVADLLAGHDIEVSVAVPEGLSVQDVVHGKIPNGSQPPNRAFTIDGVLTHPGDSREPTRTAPVLALPLMVPWDSTTGAVEFARRLAPDIVLPIHDFYMSRDGRSWIRGMAKNVLADDGIEVLDLDWGDSFSL